MVPTTAPHLNAWAAARGARAARAGRAAASSPRLALPSCHPRHPWTPRAARPTPSYCHRLDIVSGADAGRRRSRAAGQPVLLPCPHRSPNTGGASTAPKAAAWEPLPLTAPHRNGAPPAAGGCRDHRPEQPRTWRRGRRWACIRPVPGCPVHGSRGRLEPAPFVEELAAYQGVPKKTVHGCGRQWSLRDLPGWPVPAVPRAARGGMAPDPGGTTVAKIFKRCLCPEG